MKELSIVTICIDPVGPVLDRFLSSIRQYSCADRELIIVDNAGDDRERSAFLAANCDRYIRLAERASVAAAWNIGIAAASGQYVLVTNDDVVVPRDWFTYMKDVFVRHERAGLVVPVMNYAKPEQTHVGDISRFREAGPVRLVPFTQFIWGAFMLFSRESLARVDNFSEEYQTASGEDLDICFKMYEAGLDVYVDHRVFIFHEWRATANRLMGDERRRDLYEANYVQFKQKWIRYTRDWDQPKQGMLRRWWTSLTGRRSS